MKQIILNLVVLVILVSGCTNSGDALLGGEVLYLNDFETIESLDDFEFSIGYLSEDTSGSGGERSLTVSGGCVVPHMTLAKEFDKDYQLQVLIEGKLITEFGPGQVMISTDSEQVFFDIESNEWTDYESQPINYIAGERLQISLMSGGLVQVTTLFDNLQIVEVEE